MTKLSGDAPDAELADLIPRLARRSVLVVGDLMLDRYIFGAVSRISPEAPVPVLCVERELALPGGAGNVLRNLTALGAACAFISVVGDDLTGSDLTSLIGGQANVEPWLLVQGGRITTLKTRFVASGQQLLRTDQEVTGAIHPKLADRLCRIAGDALAATTVTVLSDYRKGVLAGDTPARILATAKSTGRRVVADIGGDFPRYHGADVVCCHARDVQAANGGVAASIEALARSAMAAFEFGAMVINRGAEGLALITADLAVFLPPALPHMAEEASARVASLALGVAASRPGIAVAENHELLAMLTPQGRAQRKIMAPELAAEHATRWRELGLTTGFLAVQNGDVPRQKLVAAREGCDRLVVGIEATTETMTEDARAALLSRLAAEAAVDAVCEYEPQARAAHIQAIRPKYVSTSRPEEWADLAIAWDGFLRTV